MARKKTSINVDTEIWAEVKDYCNKNRMEISVFLENIALDKLKNKASETSKPITVVTKPLRPLTKSNPQDIDQETYERIKEEFDEKVPEEPVFSEGFPGRPYYPNEAKAILRKKYPQLYSETDDIPLSIESKEVLRKAYPDWF